MKSLQDLLELLQASLRDPYSKRLKRLSCIHEHRYIRFTPTRNLDIWIILAILTEKINNYS